MTGVKEGERVTSKLTLTNFDDLKSKLLFKPAQKKRGRPRAGSKKASGKTLCQNICPSAFVFFQT